MSKKLIFIFLLTALIATAFAEDKPFIVLATTTSTENSGLLSYLNPKFTEATGIEVRVVAKGSGAALELARKGDADIVMVHSRLEEEAFLKEGFGTERFGFMHNDYVLVGPATDPAKIKDKPIDEALKALPPSGAPFISRGDQSGTHAKELELWKSAGVTPEGQWYLSAGQGMGKILTMASEKQAYTLTDRGTYLSMKDKLQLIVISQGSANLLNPYCIIPVNPAKHSHVKADLARKYADWLMSETGQKRIAEFKIGGEQLFFPDAPKKP